MDLDDFHLLVAKGDTSSHASRTIIDFIIRFCVNFDLSPTVIQATTIVRKSAHFMEYAVLGYVTRRNVGLNAQPLFYLSGFVPFLDEALQSQIAGRVGSLSDSMLDLAGYLMGVMLAGKKRRKSRLENR